jgi:hypothetical protein
MRTSKALATLLACALIAGCQIGKNPTGTLDRETFLAVYCDLLQESLRGRNVGADPRTAKQNAEVVLAKRGVSRAQFDSTTSWYNADVKRWKGFFDDVAKELENRELHPETQLR